MISVIVPIKNERPQAAERFRALAASPDVELLVADAGDDAETTRAFEAIGARTVAGPRCRGARLAAAAAAARGDMLLFVHADSELPSNAAAAVAETLSNGTAAGAFRLGYRDAGLSMRWIAWWANQRSRLLGLPFGDQGIFCRREVYERTGGFRSLPVCDDLDLVRRLRRGGRMVIRRETTFTSPRRYRARGTLRQVLRNWRVLAGYFLGVYPDKLERWYNAE
ncbi:MAG TPA: TIGR04283 family arsenosugar biosynthesis glycosyltransferase [Thermoanaerobaculia bacterium]